MRLTDLPVEILCDIFKRLPVNSICCLRCVSKNLLDIVQSPFFVSLHTRLSILSINAAADQPPGLTLRFSGEGWYECLYKKKTPSKSLECLNYDSSTGDLIVSEILSTCDNARYWIYFSYCNLFFFTRNCDGLFLIDPFTRQLLRIPTAGLECKKYDSPDIYIPMEGEGEIYGMGFDSVTSTHKILRLSYTYKHNLYPSVGSVCEAQILELGTNSWREIPAYDHELTSRASTSICAYGDMHWLTSSDEMQEILILSFDFTKENFFWTPTLELPSSRRSGYTNLIALRGSMAVVIFDISCNNIDIWVMKEYYKKQWVRDYTINVHEPALDRWLFFASCGEWKNGIFFQDQHSEKSFFVDFRSNSMQVIKHPNRRGYGWKCLKILSVNRSLFSLKAFGTLVEAKSGSRTVIDFAKNYLLEHPSN